MQTLYALQKAEKLTLHREKKIFVTNFGTLTSK